MNYQVKADLMVRRGEARDFRHACSIMASRRKRKPTVTKELSTQSTQAMRLPYKDE
jgi:hypothetical protein